MQVAFAIDGKLSDAYERAFAEHGGPRKMGFVRAMTDSDSKKRLERLVGRTMHRSMPDAAYLKAARTAETESLEVDATRPAASRVPVGHARRIPAAQLLAAAEERLATARLASIRLMCGRWPVTSRLSFWILLSGKRAGR